MTTQYEWINALPRQTDETNFEWVIGLPFVITQATAGTNWEKSLSDSITIVDSISKTFGITEADTISLSDALWKTIGLNKADALSLTDSLAKTMGLSKADTLVLSDAISVILGAVSGMLKLRDGFKFVQRKQTKL